MRAHFHVIHMASAFVSSSVTSWWYRIPPLEGPRATLCVQRNPSKTRTEPSSIRVGTETETHFLHSRRTFNMLSSIPSWTAVWRS